MIVLLKKTWNCVEEEAETAGHSDGVREDCGEGPLTKAQAVSWVGAMKNEDGTHGGHWTMEATEQVRKKLNIDCDPAAFYAAMNMMYSDYCKVAEKFSANTADFYACMAKAFLDDKDAQPHKLERYFRWIVEK